MTKMLDIFAIGEVAIYLCVGYTEECTIVAGPSPLLNWDCDTSPVLRTTDGYYARFQDGVVYFVEPHDLRKKKPPREDLKIVQWDECPWQPETINV